MHRASPMLHNVRASSRSLLSLTQIELCWLRLDDIVLGKVVVAVGCSAGLCFVWKPVRRVECTLLCGCVSLRSCHGVSSGSGVLVSLFRSSCECMFSCFDYVVLVW